MQKRGLAALAFVLLIGAVFFMMTAAVSTSVTQKQSVASFGNLKQRCRYAAYTGLQEALARMTADLNYTGVSLDNPVPGDPEALFDLEVYNNYFGTFVNPAPDGVVVPNKEVYIKTKGHLAASVTTRNITVGMATLGFVGENHFNGAGVGTRGVTVINSRTDSYRSSSGKPSKYPYEWGCLWTNGTKNAMILNNADIRGYVMTGPFSDLSQSIVKTGTTTISGNSKAVEAANTSIKRVPKYRPPFHPRDAVAVQAVNGSPLSFTPRGWRNLTIENSATVTLAPGDYYISGKLTVRTNGKIVLAAGATKTNPVTLYVGEGVEIASAFVNDIPVKSAGPGALRILFVGNGRPGAPLALTMTDSKGTFIAAGKGLEANLTRSELWGSIKGLELRLVDSKVHYDKEIFKFFQPSYVAWTLQGLVEDDDLPIDESDDGGDAGDAGDAGGDAGGGS